MTITEKINFDEIINNKNFNKKQKLDFLLTKNTQNESKDWEINIEDSIIGVNFVVITPTLAKILLTHFNDNNRPVSDTNVSNLVKEMVNEKWLVNGETITFNELGDMTNGQHRLRALIKADVTLLLLVVTGLKSETFATIDSGRKRTTSDVLAYAGVLSSKNSASLCKFIYGFKEGKYGAHKNVSARTLNNTAILGYYNSLDDVEINSSVNFGQTFSKKANGIITPTVLGGIYYILNEVNREKSNEFLTKLCTGDNLTKNSPILALRNRLIKAKIDNTYHLTSDMLVKNIIYCWEKFVNGENVKVIKVPEDYTINLQTKLPV